MKKLISAFVVFVALCELSGCGIKGKLYIEPEYIQQEDDDSSDEQASKNSSSNNNSKEDEESQEESKK